MRTVLWARAEEILPRSRLSEFNSALMELGALICVPRTPACLVCPVQAHCQGFAAGLQGTIPPPKPAKPTPLVQRWTFCLRRQDSGGEHYLIEQRPATGRWAGMWQFVTLPTAAGAEPFAALAAALKLPLTPGPSLGQVRHALTHRQYEFEVFAAETTSAASVEPRRWVTLAELSRFPLPKPHVRIAALLEQPTGVA